MAFIQTGITDGFQAGKFITLEREGASQFAAR